MRISVCSSDVCSSDLFLCCVFALKPRIVAQFSQCGSPWYTSAIKPLDWVRSRYRGPDGVVTPQNLFGTVLQPTKDFPRQGRVNRSDERRVGQEGVSTCRSLWSTNH